MPAINLGRSCYDRAELPPILLKNYFYERTPANPEDQVALIPRPRLKAFGSTVGAGPIRGLYREGNVLANEGHSGVIICLSDDELYRVPQTGVGAPTLIGTIEGSQRLSAEGSEDVVVLTAGTKAYTTDGDAVSQITFPDDMNVYAVDTLNSYYLFSTDLGRFYWSALGGTTVSALDYATAESQPDGLYTLKVIGDELWLFSRQSIEVWQPTGDLDLPFQRIGGRTFGIGITAKETAQKLNVGGVDTVCWVGTDRKVYRTDPNPKRISDHAMEERLKRVADISALYAAPDNWHGHEFYVLHIPGEGSFAYDLGTDTWHERTSYGRTLFRGGTSAIGPNNQPLLGDDTSNVIWELSADDVTDGADPVLYECAGLVDYSGPPSRCSNVLMDVAVGRTPDVENDPMMMLDWSDDFAETFSDPVAAPLGRQGQRQTKVVWTRLPIIRRPGRLFRWRTTEPVTVRKAKFNEDLR